MMRNPKQSKKRAMDKCAMYCALQQLQMEVDLDNMLCPPTIQASVLFSPPFIPINTA